MKCALCDNGISDIHNVETVSYDGVDWEVTYAVISADRQGLLCEYHERLISNIAFRQIRERNEKELAGDNRA